MNRDTRSPPPGAVLFDVDGTLAETERDGHRVAFNAAFAARGLDIRWDAAGYGRLLRVAGGRQRLRHHLVTHESMPGDDADALAAELHAVKTNLFVDIVRSGKIDARPGVHDLVHGLQRAGVPTGIVTTGRRAWVEPLVTHLIGRRARDRLCVVVAGDDVTTLKPSPEAYLLAMEKLEKLMPGPARGIAIEDSVNGVESAKAAGLACVAVPSLYNRDDDFGAADLIVAEFDWAGTDGGPGSLLENPDFLTLLFDR